MTKLIFTILHKTVFKSNNVFIHMFVNEETHSIMTRLLNDDV